MTEDEKKEFLKRMGYSSTRSTPSEEETKKKSRYNSFRPSDKDALDLKKIANIFKVGTTEPGGKPS